MFICECKPENALKKSKVSMGQYYERIYHIAAL
jgi:hypothetical protein